MFGLDERLRNDTVLIGDFPLSRLLLMNDANYPWFILVPKVAQVSELFELSQQQQLLLWRETTELAQMLKQAFGADKMNVATLGNVVSQLHMHVVVRYEGDPAWPAPVWGRAAAKPYEPEQKIALLARLKGLLPSDFVFAEA